MATGSLKLNVTDVAGDPVAGQIDIDLEPRPESSGGLPMDAQFANDVSATLIVEKIECRGGPGTTYLVRVNHKNFRSYAFFQVILEKKVNTASDTQIRLLVNPKRVKNISAPAFASLPAPGRTFLGEAAMTASNAEDRDLLGLTGPALYDAIGPLRKACLLNLFAKTRHASAAKCFRFLQSLRVLRQDRCFCVVDPAMPEFLRKSESFRSAPRKLHEPLDGFALEDSFKSLDTNANLQVTFMRHRNGVLAADVDIDESVGIEHGFEVIRNAATKGRTNPYLIRELMLLADPKEKTLDPGYRFVFA